MPWKRRAVGRSAGTDSLTSRGSLSTGSSAGLMRFTLVSNRSSDTLAFRLMSFARLRSWVSATGWALTNAWGTEFRWRNSCTCSGISENAAGVSSAAAEAAGWAPGVAAFLEDFAPPFLAPPFFAGAFFFVAMFRTFHGSVSETGLTLLSAQLTCRTKTDEELYTKRLVRQRDARPRLKYATGRLPL